MALVAPYCAIPRNYLSDTPLLRAMGFLVSQHGQLGAIPPPPFLSVSPLESMRSGGAIPPLKRGISAILARYPMKTRQMGAIPPSAILSRQGIARYGGVSRTGPLSEYALVPILHRGNIRTYPRPGFLSGGTSECTLAPVFVFAPGEHPPRPPFTAKTTLHPVVNPQL